MTDRTAAHGSALVQLRSALRMCERDGSNLVSVPFSVAEIRALLASPCEHEWSEWEPVLGGRGYHVERKCSKCGKEQYDD